MKKVVRYFLRAVLLCVVILCVYQLWILTHILVWKKINPSETSFMAIRLVELRKKNASARLQFQWVDYEKISMHLKQAVVASEDDKFMEHRGFDWEGIHDAFEKNQRKGKSVAGGSTITQQLAKNLFLSPSRSYFRKIEEAIISMMIELVWDKRRILEVYLNVVEWGSGVFGAEAAARHYYQTSAKMLNKEQAVHIAVMLPNPRKFEQNYPRYVFAHAQRVLERMHYSSVP
jgi:monofunctional glycosyltransferase